MNIEKIGFYLYMQEQEEKRKATANDRKPKCKEHLEREQTTQPRKTK